MGRGGAIYMSYTALVLLSRITVTDASIWTIDIDESPAPSPEDGPPFSANASRDVSLLPYQIIGIVGSYICVTLIVMILMLTVGRKARRLAQERALIAKEMVRPLRRTFSSPQSMTSSSSWYNLRAKKSMSTSLRSLGGSKHASPVDQQVAFDPMVLERDKRKNEQQMADIWTRILAEENGSQGQSDPYAYPPRTPVSPQRPPGQTYTNFSRGGSQKYAPTIDEHQEAAPLEPTTPASIQRSPSKRLTKRRLEHIKTGSASTAGGLNISSPIQRYPHHRQSAEDMHPFAPRTYEDPGTPPEPPTARTVNSQYTMATTPGTMVASDWHHRQEQNVDNYEIGAYGQGQPYVQPYNYRNEAQALTDLASTRTNPIPQVYQSPAKMNRPAASAPRKLLLRDEQWDGLASPRFKETVLETKDRSKQLAVNTAGMNILSPWTATTPFTPITPRLTTRADRKQKQREERAIRGAITEEDQVPDDAELWSKAY